MEAPLGNLVYTTDGSVPSCSLGTTTRISLVLTADSSFSARACSLWLSRPTNVWVYSELTSRTYTISPGPVVEVSFPIGGTVTAADMTSSVKDAFKSAFATSMGE